MRPNVSGCLWSALTCQRFGKARLVALSFFQDRMDRKITLIFLYHWERVGLRAYGRVDPHLIVLSLYATYLRAAKPQHMAVSLRLTVPSTY
jgi:hypothetical protein